LSGGYLCVHSLEHQTSKRMKCMCLGSNGGKNVGISVALVTRDELLAACCREILSELFGTKCNLMTGARVHLDPDDNLCIWDFDPRETAVPRNLEPSQFRRHWFLLHRQDLTALQALVGADALNVLLKPVSRAALRTLLSEAGRAEKERNSDSTGLADVLRGERDEMLQFLIQANLKLQENDQEQNNFLARSLHDFRAPLTAISGYCGLLLEEELGPLTQEQRKVLERMLHSATRLARISNGMFQLSVPQSVDPRLNLERADLRDCLDQALHEVALRLEDKRISIAAEIERVPDGLFFEKSQIEQTLVNLLDNGCKFTPRDGTIEIRGYPFFWERRTGPAAARGQGRERRARQVETFNSFRIDIRDSGPGIPAGHLDKIFEECTSYGGGLDRSGGGLGLAICRMILHRHQGHIWAESTHSGAMFSFVLPLQPTDARPSDRGNNSEAVSLFETVEN
jgi:signal transduction histidine kinase